MFGSEEEGGFTCWHFTEFRVSLASKVLACGRILMSFHKLPAELAFSIPISKHHEASNIAAVPFAPIETKYEKTVEERMDLPVL